MEEKIITVNKNELRTRTDSLKGLEKVLDMIVLSDKTKGYEYPIDTFYDSESGLSAVLTDKVNRYHMYNSHNNTVDELITENSNGFYIIDEQNQEYIKGNFRPYHKEMDRLSKCILNVENSNMPKDAPNFEKHMSYHYSKDILSESLDNKAEKILKIEYRRLRPGPNSEGSSVDYRITCLSSDGKKIDEGCGSLASVVNNQGWNTISKKL